MDEGLINIMANSFAHATVASRNNSASNLNKNLKLYPPFLISHHRHFERRIERLMFSSFVNEYHMERLLVDELYRSDSQTNLSNIPRRDVASVFVLERLMRGINNNDGSDRLIERSEELLREIGVHVAIGFFFQVYTNLFLVPAVVRAEQLLVEEAVGFKRLPTFPRVDFEERFGTLVHQTLREGHVVSLEFFYHEQLRKIRSLVRFGRSAEGAPGWTHGGIVSAVCDMFLARSSMILFGSSVTRDITVRYRSPVPLLGVCSVMVLEESTEKRVHAQALDEDGILLFDCEGSFAQRSKL